MKFAVIALLGLSQTIQLAHKGEDETKDEKPVWREF